MPRGRPRKITEDHAGESPDMVAPEPVKAKTVKVRVKRDGVWLKEDERSDKGNEATIDAAVAEIMKEGGFVDIL